MASTSHNPTSPPPTRYDVFLSFRGDDTRHSFTDHLYQALKRTAIRIFRDNPELHSGEVISGALSQAIQESKIYIVVFSENYATSSWCLKELVDILACFKRMERLVIPVFYHIDPTVIRHQTASFQKAFEKHQIRYDLEEVNKWRSTLNEVAGFSGYHIPKNSSEADVIDKIVERVLDETTPITLDVAEFPVGLDSRVKVVTELFNTVKEGVNRIGIYGMGGVGKTTLAKAVYNRMHRCFSGSCFLANVSEVSRTKGLASLQQKLISDVLKKKSKIDDVDQGIEFIRARIPSKKVLVVIDDLDNSDHLRYLEGPFALGSVVIITTRNEILLNDIGVNAKYKVNEMSEDESHKLFAQHAFNEDKIPDRFTELSKEILKRVGGLPLALKVCGSALFDKLEEGWNWYIGILKEAPITGVEEKLMISFDALKFVDPNLQNIFLDIACFCIGINIDMVFRIMESCYEHVPYRIDLLKKRCLITVSEHGDLRMHDLLCDMGRNIARKNCPDKPGKHSRLWVSKDIDTVLKDHKGTKAIQGIIPENFSFFYYNNIPAREVKFDAKSFKRMSDLRLLYLNNVNITGSFKKKFEKLRWLCWERCPLECLPSEFYPQKLVTLELRCSKMKAMWEPNMVGTSSTCLVHKCSRLYISARGNVRYSELPPNLKSISARGCTSLKRLPNLSNLKQLEQLDPRECQVLTEIKGLEELTCLLQLFLDGCIDLLSISELPPNLKSISARGCTSLKRLPDLSNLKQLEELDLRECQVLTEIKGLEELTCLRQLFLDGCIDLLSISELPPNLKSISARGCTLERLPNLSNLKQLEELNLEDCSGLTEIKGPEELTSLKYLNLKGCNSSLVESTLTIRFFQILSGFGHTIQIQTQIGSFEFEESSKVFGSRMSFDLQPSASYNLMGIIFCFSSGDVVTYSIKHIRSGFEWSGEIIVRDYAGGSVIVIVPSSVFLIEDGHNALEVISNSDEEISCGIHLVYETEIKMISGYNWYNDWESKNSDNDSESNNSDNDSESNNSDNDSESNNSDNEKGERIKPSEHNLERTTVNVEDERSKPSDNDLESNKKWLTLGSSSTNVNVEESNNSDNEKGERIKPSDNDLESKMKRLTLGSSSPPSKRLKRWECDSNWLSLSSNE